MTINSFNWQREKSAEALILEHLELAEKNPFLSDLKASLFLNCSTGLLEWIDHLSVSYSKSLESRLSLAGFEVLYSSNGSLVYRHQKAQLPDMVLDREKKDLTVAVIVESIAEFLSVRGIHRSIEGTAFSGYRRSIVEEGVMIVERRGVQTLTPCIESLESLQNYFLAKELWMTRSRASQDQENDFKQASLCVEKIVALIGQDRAASLVLACERGYWQARNTAGQIQKNRQDRLGMGWANHDHHTFRSSRIHFSKLVHLFQQLGFHCRERYYTGATGGWGAQIMENPRSKLVLFLDVDLGPSEIAIDFSRTQLSEGGKLGTIGLWCALHGDSILKGGMHHLEAQFSFDALTKDLSSLGVPMMDPFSHFPYLKQAFTQGEMWPVSNEKIESLLSKGQISLQQAEQFRVHGAIGSHLENLERKEGYKGFNQKNVSLIIKETDPRLKK